MSEETSAAAPQVEAEAPRTQTKTATAAFAYSPARAQDEVIIHARFHPNGLVNTINEKPSSLSAQDWFDRLCRTAPTSYQPLAGGRGVFRIPSDLFALIREESVGD